MVYLLYPASLDYKWRRIDTVPLETAEKKRLGLPIDQSDMPAETRLDSKFELPDICAPTQGFMFSSDRGRAALEELAPGCVQFFTLNVKAPDRMRPAKAYFYLDVTGRAQSIDWDRSETGPCAGRQREPRC